MDTGYCNWGWQTEQIEKTSSADSSADIVIWGDNVEDLLS